MTERYGLTPTMTDDELREVVQTVRSPTWKYTMDTWNYMIECERELDRRHPAKSEMG